MNDKKTIKINPDLFKINIGDGKKSKNNTTVRNKPIISSSKLRNKFLNKIKEYKNNEFNETKYNLKKDVIENMNTIKRNEKHNGNDDNNDDFKESLDFLTKLSNDKSKQLQQLRNSNKTLKNHNNHINVNIELPKELIEYNNINIPRPNTNSPELKLHHYNVDKDVPFGCLKGGIKPCYRTWKTIKNTHSGGVNTNTHSSLNKEERIRLINNKLKNLSKQRPSIQNTQYTHTSSYPVKVNNIQPIQNDFSSSYLSQQNSNNLPILYCPEHHIQQSQEYNKSNNDYIIPTKQQNNNEMVIKKDDVIIKSNNDNIITNIMRDDDKTEEKEQSYNKIYESKDILEVPVSQTIKKTIRKKFTLGKNKLKRKIGVLIKNHKTRKNIMEQHKILKSKPINDVKKYLREHNFIKSGSQCPTDVLRKIYESAILSGDVINNDKDIMIHNLTDEIKE